MPPASTASPGLGTAKCIGLVVFFLESLPTAELVLPLNDYARHEIGVAGTDVEPILGVELDSRAKYGFHSPLRVCDQDVVASFRVLFALACRLALVESLS
jgi:hypothetical protein